MSKKLPGKAVSAPQNFRFREMVKLAEAFGFGFSRKRGSHHIYVHPSASELLSSGGRRQGKAISDSPVPQLVEKYNLELGED